MGRIAIDECNNRVYIDDVYSKHQYYCPICNSILIVKNKGKIRQHYFAHKCDCKCSESFVDRNYEANVMSDWHIDWQESFPIENREFVLKCGKIKHRADILVGKTVIEFQHSNISPEIFQKRSKFYLEHGCKVIWVFDCREFRENGSLSYHKGIKYIDFRWEQPFRCLKYMSEMCEEEQNSIDIVLQLYDSNKYGSNKCLSKVYEVDDEGFECFKGSLLISKNEFLNKFKENGIYRKPELFDKHKNEIFESFMSEYKLNLNEQQQRAVMTIEGNTLLRAVPGSGKTTVIVARTAYMIKCEKIDVKSILILTYTKSAVEDIKRRFEILFPDIDKIPEVKTINKLGFDIIKYYCQNDKQKKHDRIPKIISSKEKISILENICKTLNIEVKGIDFTDLENKISYMKNTEEIFEDNFYKKIYDNYNQYLNSNKQIDFDDQIVYANRILKKSIEIKKIFSSKYKYLCVDEAQDTSKIQHDLIKNIAEVNNNLFMVGDEDQSIYRYRGAYPKALLSFRSSYVNLLILKLEINYRSKHKIVDIANKFIKYSNRPDNKIMRSNETDCGVVDRIDCLNSSDINSKVIDICKNINTKTAFLYRQNKSVIAILELLNKNNIRYRILNKDNKDIKKILSNKDLSDPSSNIILSTVHSSKGLEFDDVYLIDAYNGVFPCNEEEIDDEERRMFYVAMTRAKNKLFLFYNKETGSVFIDEILPKKYNRKLNHEDNFLKNNIELANKTINKHNIVNKLCFYALINKIISASENDKKVIKMEDRDYSQNNKIIRDRCGIRYVKCVKCSRIADESHFYTYGGKYGWNQGICRDCEHK